MMVRMVRVKGDLADVKFHKPHKKKLIARLERKLSEHEGRVETMRKSLEPVFLSILINQYLHIVEVYEKHKKKVNRNATGEKAWDHVCIGSDYEGVINPIDIYYYASDLKTMETQLTLFWNQARVNPDPKFKKYQKYLYSKTPSWFVKKILWGNSQWFLKKYFNDKYLSK